MLAFQFNTGTGTKSVGNLKLDRRKCADTRGVAKLLPIKGLSLVIGMISDTVFRNIVSERRIVTPENQSFISLPFDSIHT